MKIIFNYNGISKSSSVYKAYSRLTSFFFIDKDNDIYFEEYSLSMRNYDYIVCANIWQVLITKLFLLGSRCKIIFWVQGAVAEESLLRNRSYIRFFILKAIENMCFYLSDAYIFVSPYMKEFYNKKPYVRKRPSLIFPCISDLTYNKNKKTPLSFCYLGGMSVWQCFPDTVNLMNKIENNYPESVFKVATNDPASCIQIIKERASKELVSKLEVYSLKSKKEIEDFLGDCSFGFLIREDSFLNNVSSPIKMAEYLSCGVNVITTSAVKSYAHLLGDAGIVLDSNLDIENIFFKGNVNAALEVYDNIFSEGSLRDNFEVFIDELSYI